MGNFTGDCVDINFHRLTSLVDTFQFVYRFLMVVVQTPAGKAIPWGVFLSRCQGLFLRNLMAAVDQSLMNNAKNSSLHSRTDRAPGGKLFEI